MQRWITWTLMIVLLHVSAVCYAQSVATSPRPVQVKLFDPAAAHKTLDQLSFKLSTEQLVIAHLEEAVKTLIDLKTEAEACVKTGEGELKEVGVTLSVILAETDKTEKLTEEQKYLQGKKKKLTDRVSNCRLFILRSQEAIDAFTYTIQEKVTTKLFKPQTPFWENYIKYPHPVQALYEKFDTKKFIENSGLYYFNKFVIACCFIIFALSIILSQKLRRIIRYYLKPEAEEEFADKMKMSFYAVVKRYVLIFVPLLAISLFLSIITLQAETLPFVTGAVDGVLGYYIYLSFVRFIFYPGSQVKNFTGLPKKIAKKSFHRLDLLGILGLFGYLGYLLLSTQEYPIELLRVARSIFFVIFGLSFLNIIWVINRIPDIHHKLVTVRLIISIFIGASLLIMIGSEILGYYDLASHVMLGNVLTIFLGVFLWFVHKLVSVFFDKLNEVKHPWQEKMRHYLTFGRRHPIPEIILLKIIVQTFVWIFYTATLIRYWSASDAQYHIFLDALVDGFSIAGVEIVMSRVVVGAIVFSILALITRLVRSYFRRKVKMVKDPGGQEALATIIGYIGFAAAIIFAMFAAGVNFTGIAIIAGALSVGIGFGLQNIVGNFVSGIILLIERPIKVGDRIFVAGEEGKVKKISIRSTRVRTQNNSDLIVPNSEIVAATVTNFMFGDRYFRVDIDIGVAYGSDVELVKSVLEKIVHDHDDIVKQIEHLKPRILFWSHGDSALIFQIRCNITDVNKRYNVQSDLNFAINKAFAENNIDIPFPQTDIHVKEFPTYSAKKPE